jgi:tetratricopeptide (TPR) repeat protein
MTNPKDQKLPPPSPDHRRVAAGQFDRANQVIATGNFDYGIRLLLSCCKIDPGNLIYRQALRRTEKAKYKNNMRGSWHAGLSTWTTLAKIKAVQRGGDHLKVIDLAEQVLARNPWDITAQKALADAADNLGLLDLAIWTLEQARQKDPRHLTVNRALARLYEKRGNFTQAIALWELVRKVAPTDVEAQHKVKDLAVSETIARGGYEASAADAPPGSAEHRKAPSGRVPSLHPGRKPVSPPAPGQAPGHPAPTGVVSSEQGSREVEQLQARIETDPTSASAYLQLAAHYRKLDQLDQARAVLQRGLGPTGNAFELTVQLAELDIEPFRRNLAAAEDKLRAAPGDEELRKIHAQLVKDVNAREMELFRHKAERYPSEMVHRFELGLRLFRAGQTDEAIRELQTARNDPRYHSQALLQLAYCFKARNNWRLAKRNFDECLQSLPASETTIRKEVLFQLAQGSAEAGELSAAIEVGQELANLDFGYKDIGRLLDEWQARLEQADG